MAIVFLMGIRIARASQIIAQAGETLITMHAGIVAKHLGAMPRATADTARKGIPITMQLRMSSAQPVLFSLVLPIPSPKR